MAVKTYDPKNVKVIFGVIELSGFAEGTMISIASNGPKFEKTRGGDGQVNRINKNAGDYTVTVTLDRTSLSNDLLSAALIADVNTNGGIVPFTVKDLNGTSVFFAAEAWIANDPDSEEADTMPTREWTIDTGKADKFDGGNS